MITIEIGNDCARKLCNAHMNVISLGTRGKQSDVMLKHLHVTLNRKKTQKDIQNSWGDAIFNTDRLFFSERTGAEI